MRWRYYFIISILAIGFSSTNSKELDEIREDKFYWPVKGKKGKKVSSTFGEPRVDHFHNGVDIPGENLSIYPLQKGNLIWMRSNKRRLNEVPAGGGNTIILKHKKIWSGYMHLKEIDKDITPGFLISSEDPIGYSGNTGHSGGAHLHFFIYAPQSKRYYNPFLFLEKEFIKDEKPPIVKGYYAKLSKKVFKINLDRSIALSDDHSILVDLKDRGVGNERWGIYMLKVFSPDSIDYSYDLKFDYIEFNDFQWTNSDHLPYEKIYYRNKYYLRNQFKSNVALKWEASGFTGPSIKVNKYIRSSEK